MSFILDSLKRAERERRLGEKPALYALYEENAPPARPRKTSQTWLVGVLLANLAALALVLGIVLHTRSVPDKVPLPDRPDRQTTAATAAPHPPAMPSAAPKAPAVEPQAPPFPSSSLAEPPAVEVQTETTAPIEEQARSTAVRFGPPVAVSAGGTGRIPGGQVGETAAPDRTPRTPRTSPAAVVPERDAPAAAGALTTEELPSETLGSQAPRVAPSSPTASATSAPMPVPEKNAALASASPSHLGTAPDAVGAHIPRTAAPAQKPAAARPLPAVSQDADQGIPLLQELSPDLREKFKRLKINVLVYDARPAASVVYINSRRYRAGDRIGSEGYLLERITADGIVLDYGDGKVKIRTGH